MSSAWLKAVLFAAVSGAAQAVTNYQMTGGTDPVFMAIAALIGVATAVVGLIQKSPLDR